MPFTIGNEKQNRMSFLDVQIIREDTTFTISVYRKPTFSGVYTHFNSFLLSSSESGTVYTIAYRCFQICSGEYITLHTELVCLQHILLKNGYPKHFSNVSKDLWVTYTY